MYISSKASRIRQREAQKARDNRAEIVKALSLGQITRRDLFKWGLLTSAGVLACKNGLSPFARSAFADVPTGTPRSPLFGAAKFSQPMPRLQLQTPMPLTRNANDEAVFPAGSGYDNAKRLSYHKDFSSYVGDPAAQPVPQPDHQPGADGGPAARRVLRAPALGGVLPQGRLRDVVGPVRARHQASTRISPPRTRTACGATARARSTQGTHAAVPDQGPLRRADPHPHLQQHAGRPRRRTAASAATRRSCTSTTPTTARRATAPPARTISRHVLRLPLEHHARPARQDQYRRAPTTRAAGPDNGTGIVKVPGDWRELQGTMWAHDHRFFFTAENVYKGNLGMVNYYSGRGPRPRDDHRRAPTCGCPAARNWAGATSISTSTWSSPTAPPIRAASTSSTSSPPTASWATCRSSTSPTRPTSRCCRASTASASSTPCMSRFFKLAHQLERGAGAVQVHRQRRQLGRQSDRR